MQHVVDSWYSPIGSTAIMIVIAFLNSHSDLLSTDEERQERVTWYLQDLCFTYKDSDSDDKNVCAYDCTVKH